MTGATGKTTKRTHRRDRVVRRLLLVVFLLALVTFFVPTIIGSSPLLNSFLASALPAEAGRVSANGASLGWFAPVRLQGIQVTGPDGQVLLQAESLQTNRTLLSLITSGRDLGVVEAKQPVLYVVAGSGGSNIEQFIDSLGKDQGEQQEPKSRKGQSTRFELRVVGGAIAVADTETGRTMIHDPIDLNATYDGGLKGLRFAGSLHPLTLAPGASLPRLPLADSALPGRGKLEAVFTPAPRGANGGNHELQFQLQSADLAALRPWLARFDSSLQLAGVASGQGAASWVPASVEGGPPKIQSAGRLQAVGPQLLSAATNGDAIRSEAMDIAWQVETAGDGGLRINQLQFSSDFANGAATGQLSATELTALLAGGLPAPRNAQISARVDLARLARVAPNALHLREGVTLRSGEIRIEAGSRPEGDATSLGAELFASDLVASRAGKTLRWDQPVKISLAGAQRPSGFEVSRLACESDFLSGTVAGDPNNFSGGARLDLNKLMSQAKQFFDFGPWRLSGQAEVDFRFARAAGDRFQTTAGVDLIGCVVTQDGRPVLMEQQLTIGFSGEGQAAAESYRPLGFVSAELKIATGDDRLGMRLTQPTGVSAASYPLDIRLVGDLTAWLRRLKFVAQSGSGDNLLENVKTKGIVDARLVGGFSPQNVRINSATIQSTGLVIETPTLRIEEPRAQFTGDISWDSASGAVVSQGGRLTSTTLDLQARGFELQGSAARGEVTLGADLGRLAAWKPGLLGEKQRISGQLSGGLRLAGGGDRSAEVDLAIQQFKLSETGARGRERIVWQEPQLRLEGGIVHSAADDRLTLRNLRLQSRDLSALIQGRVDQMSAAARPEIAATVDYDLASMGPLVAGWLGPGVELSGRHQAKLQLATDGKVDPDAPWSQRWKGRFTAPWSRATVYGLPCGPGVLSASLGQGHLRCEPLQIDVAGGRLATQPVVRFDPAPAAWGLPAGELLSEVQITQEISDKMLKYFAPIVADATRSEGTFSLRTDGAHALLENPAGLQASGQLTVRGLRVTPGPSVADLVSVARQVKALAKDKDPAAALSGSAPTLLSISERTVDFQVAGGRVYHRGLEFDVDGVPVSSTGSVGFDETVQLTLSIPIQDRWVKDRRLVGLRGQRVDIPVGGTLRKLRPDLRALQALVQKGVQGAIESEIGRAFEKLFD